VEPSVPAREFNLKAYAAIACRNEGASLGLEPRLAASDHRSRTVTLATAPLQQADLIFKIKERERENFISHNYIQHNSN